MKCPSLLLQQGVSSLKTILSSELQKTLALKMSYINICTYKFLVLVFWQHTQNPKPERGGRMKDNQIKTTIEHCLHNATLELHWACWNFGEVDEYLPE